jgi:hypothetical protein
MPRTHLGLSIDSESSGGSGSCSCSSSYQTDDESLENPVYWAHNEGGHQKLGPGPGVGPPTHVWNDESPTLSPLQIPRTAVESFSLPMLSSSSSSSDYSSASECSSIHQSCHFQSRVRRRMEQLEQQSSLSSDCSENGDDDDDLVSRQNHRRPKWRIYLALVAIAMVVLSHSRPPRPFVEIRREEVALGNLRSYSKSHKLPKYFMPKFDSNAAAVSAAAAAAASPATTTEKQGSAGSATSARTNFALAQTSQASRPIFERFEFQEEEEPLSLPPPSSTSWTTYFAGMTFFCLLVETTYKEYRAYRLGRREERRL